MAVALRASHRQSHPDRHGCIDAIDHRHVAKLLVVGAPFVIGQRVAVEGGGDQIPCGCMRQQVAGKLQTSELVERERLIERLHDPVAVRPDGSGRIVCVASRIGIPRQIQPSPRLMLPIGWRGKQAIDLLDQRIGIRIGKVDIQFLSSRWQSSQIQRHPSQQRGWIGLWRSTDPVVSTRRFHPPIDRVIGGQTCRGDFGHGMLLGRRERPVCHLWGSSRNPTSQQFDFVITESVSKCRGWHPDIRIGGGDAIDQLAGIRIPCHNRPLSGGQQPKCGLALIQPQPCLHLLLIRSMTSKAAIGKQRTHRLAFRR